MATQGYPGYRGLVSRDQIRPPDEEQPCWPSQSLWSRIAEQLPGSELPKIRGALGTALVDMDVDLHAEAERWHQMWKRPDAQRGPGRGPPLADPPAVKELVRGEVEMLLQTLSERSRAGGSSADEMVSRYKPEVVHYVLGPRFGPRDAVKETRPWSPCPGRSAAADEIEAVRDKLNITHIDQAVDRLKAALVEECGALKKLLKHFKDDIKQRCRSESGKQEPTLQGDSECVCIIVFAAICWLILAVCLSFLLYLHLKDLRGAIQTDLRLFGCSQAASPPTSSSAVLKASQHTFRLPALQTSSVESLLALNTVIKPHPPPPLCQKPGQPPMAARSRATASVKQRNISGAAHRCIRLNWTGNNTNNCVQQEQIMVKSTDYS